MAHPLVELCFSSASSDGDGDRPIERRARSSVSTGNVAPTGPAIDMAHLAAQIRANDEWAFEQLFRLLYPNLVRVAAVYTDSDTAADVVVAVFTTIWNGRHNWYPHNVDAFCYRAVRNRALDTRRGTVRELRRRDSYAKAAAEEIDAPAALTDDPRLAAVQAAVAELNPRQREFVVLRWQEGRTPAEIAVLMGTTVRAITSLQDRTLAILRRRAQAIFAERRG